MTCKFKPLILVNQQKKNTNFVFNIRTNLYLIDEMYCT